MWPASEGGRGESALYGILAAEQYASPPIFSVAIGLHIYKSGGDKIQIINSDGDMSPVEMTPLAITLAVKTESNAMYKCAAHETSATPRGVLSPCNRRRFTGRCSWLPSKQCVTKQVFS